MKLVLEVEIQQYDESELEILTQLRDTLLAVISLCDTAVATFVRTDLQGAEN